MITTYYDKANKVWVAYFSDSIGQIGDAEMAMTKEVACFNLGLEVGSHPERFTRDIGEYMPAYEAELAAAK
jgi:hypothetical protein